MSKRRKLLFACVAVAAVAVSLMAGPQGYWRLVGWWRAEPFYDGMPASYWRSEISRRDVFVIGVGGLHRMDYYLFVCYTPWEELCNRVGQLIPAVGGRPGLSVLNSTPDAVPVLTVLIDDPEPKVRAAAVQALGGLGVLSPDLEQLITDKAVVWGETTVGEVAETALRRIRRSRPSGVP